MIDTRRERSKTDNEVSAWVRLKWAATEAELHDPEEFSDFEEA